MSLKDAVSALRSLKAELEASRSSKAELEVAYRGVVNVRVIAFSVASGVHWIISDYIYYCFSSRQCMCRSTE